MPGSDPDPRWEAPASQPDRQPESAETGWPGAVGEQPTAQLPRRSDGAQYPYPSPSAGSPDPGSHPPVDPRPYPAAGPGSYPVPGSSSYPGRGPDSYPAPGSGSYPAAGSEPVGGWYPAEPAGPWGPSAPTPPAEPTRYQPPPRGSHLPPYQEPFAAPPGPSRPGTSGPGAAEPGGGAGSRPEQPGTTMPPGGPAAERTAGPGHASETTAKTPGVGRTGPKKLTVTRVAAFRSRELTTRGMQIFHRAATADGADRSGLTSLTYAVMGNYAVDAALAVALANTLFFAAAKAESTGKVLLYLLITVAPFAVIAPLIGPALDKLQHGRRIALAASSFARAVLAIVMAVNFDSWVLYPCALGMLVLSKSFGVLKAAVTPRVLPPDITLVKTNSRLTVFGLIAGGVAGALAAGLSWAFGSTGALIFTALLSVIGGWLCLRIPAWVESTEGEVPVDGVRARTRRAFPLSVTTTLWSNGSIRVETGFLALFIAFVIKSEYADASAFTQLLLLGVVGVAAGVGGFLGNAIGARLPLTKPDLVSIGSLAAVVLSTLIAALIPGLTTASIVGLVGSTASSLAKVCLDSVIQHELPEASRASAFGVSETALQLSWVFGGVVGLLIGGVWTFGHDSVYTIGFAVVTVLLAVGLAQSWLVRRGRSLFPWLHYSKLGGRFRKGRTSPTGPTTGLGSSPGSPATAHWPAQPAAGHPPPAGSTPFGQPPWSTGPTAAGYPAPGPYPPGTAYGPPGYPPPGTGGPQPPRAQPPGTQPPGTWSSGQDATPRHHQTPRDAGSPRRKTRDP